MFEVVCRFIVFSEAFAESPVSTDTWIAAKAFFEVTTMLELSSMALPIGAGGVYGRLLADPTV